jgi:FKBP-type peptidyl-prolyl cis-trans isomerase (trigger factor)
LRGNLNRGRGEMVDALGLGPCGVTRGGSSPLVRTGSRKNMTTQSTIEKQEDGTVKITLTLPYKKVEIAREEVIGELAKDANVAGFRKGKAPQDFVKDRLNPDHVREEVLKKLLPQAYMEAVQEHNVKPIMNPKMHVEKIDEGSDWVLNALTCELPEIDPGAYKANIKKLTAASRIVIPGKESEDKKPTTDQIVKVVLESAKVQIPQVLLDQETDRLLSQLLADIKKLGLSLDQYLASTKRSPEDLRNEYNKRAEEDIKLELVLQKISEVEKISVEPKEVDEAIEKAKDPAEKQNLEANKYLLTSILRQQKTLDFLLNL